MNEKFKILSIDGGGMRGIIPAKILCELEEELQRREGPEARLCDYFDLICGTSTGGIIAIGLALGMSAKEMLNLYVAHGKEIFSATLLQRFKSRTLYNREALKKHLQQAYGDTRIDDCRTRICVPTYDMHEGRIHVLKTKHHAEYVRDYHIPTVDVALSTSAAPVYFSPYSFEYSNIGSDNTNHAYHYIDGGVFANNPSLIGLTEAIYCLNVPIEQIELLSIGTGELLLRETEIEKKMGFTYWLHPKSKDGFRIYELVSSAQSLNIHNTMTMLCKGAGNSVERRFNYIRLQSTLSKQIDLDATDKNSIKELMLIGQSLYKDNATRLYPFIETKITPYM